MVTNKEQVSCDLLIIGAGMAGMAAALFAARQNIDTVQVGLTSEIAFASGLIDLLGVHPSGSGQIVDDPWEGIARLCREDPDHPYARLDTTAIRLSLEHVLLFFKQNGYPYEIHPSGNVFMITPVGMLKPTWAVPHTMRWAPWAMAQKKATLLVDLDGLKGYSARQIAQSLSHRWPKVVPVRVSFQDPKGELYTEQIARSMDWGPGREKMIAAIRPHLGRCEAVGLPAVLGIQRTVEVLADLEKGLGVPVFEIPTMLPAVTGLRLQNIFEHNLPALGIRRMYPARVVGVQRQADDGWSFEIADDHDNHRRIKARSVLLCSGRFFGRGLHADRRCIRETIFDLPVVQPSGRVLWHRKRLFDPLGHPIHRAGLVVDDHFRPIDPLGRTLYDNLFAAGTILAHQDWMRQKCGSGLSIATAYGAVSGCRSYLASEGI
jgi:glycerol-3-phosphate dehydrogenase subunit B